MPNNPAGVPGAKQGRENYAVMNSCIEAATPAGKPITQLEMVGGGVHAYLWIGCKGGFYGYIDNTPELRKFIRGALKRLESSAGRTRKAQAK